MFVYMPRFQDGEPNHGGVGPEHASDTLLGDGPR